MEPSGLLENITFALTILAVVGGFIWWVARTKATLDDHDKRINHLESETKTEIGALRKDIDDLKIEMIKGFAKLGVELGKKQDIDQ